jgi:hypothetical protein
MKLFACLIIEFDDDYKNTQNFYDVKMFKTNEERLKYLVTFYENTLSEYGKKKDMFVNINDDNTVTLKECYKTYNGLHEISNKVLSGNFVYTKLNFYLYEEEV